MTLQRHKTPMKNEERKTLAKHVTLCNVSIQKGPQSMHEGLHPGPYIQYT